MHSQAYQTFQNKQQITVINSHNFSDENQRLVGGVAVEKLKLSIGTVCRNSQSASKDFRKTLLGRPEKLNSMNTGRDNARVDQVPSQGNQDTQLRSPYPNSALQSNYVVTGKHSRKSYGSYDRTFFTPKNTQRIKGLNLPNLDANLAYEEHLYKQSQESQSTKRQKEKYITPIAKSRFSGSVKTSAIDY